MSLRHGKLNRLKLSGIDQLDLNLCHAAKITTPRVVCTWVEWEVRLKFVLAL